MRSWFETILDPRAGREPIRRRPYGMIEVADGRLRRIVLRPFPALGSWLEMSSLGRWTHARRSGDTCRLYFNQPLGHRNYLALKYVVSTSKASFRTCRLAALVLDEIARIKRSDAILCDVANWRISDRLLARWGWEPIRPDGWRRLFIKRFYGQYPPSRLEAFGDAEDCRLLGGRA